MSTRASRSTSKVDDPSKMTRKQLKQAALSPDLKKTKSASKDLEDNGPTKKLKPSESKDSKLSTKKDEPIKQEKKTSTPDKNTDNNKNGKYPAKSPAKSPAKQPQKIQKKQVKLILKGKIPVDPFVQSKNVRVLVDNNTTYAATLNQSNIKNNNNKFYIIQVLQSQTNSNNFYFYTRWGRVGVQGQKSQAGPMTKQKAIQQYKSKLTSKTKAGQYRIVQMNYQQDNDKKQKEKEKVKIDQKKQQIKSTLHPKVQDLIRLIFDMKMMNNQMKQIGYDANKMPLGKLAKSSIMKGYQALKKLMQEVKNKKRKDIIAEHSSDFYSNIPHDFGFKNMSLFILDTEPKIRAKLEMLQSLEDIQIFTKLLDEGSIASDMNQLDSNYLKLNTQITPLAEDSQEYKIIKKYIQNTHATTHTNFKLIIEQVYTLSKQTENTRYRSDLHNKQLLWHGSRLTNYVGILSQGLRIAPPEAPVTGYMFGKGVYFADMVSKSANYCFTNSFSNTGLMLLCEVALGNQNLKYSADYYANLLPENKHSTKGCGKTAPDGGENVGDVFVPNGIGKNTNISSSSLLYNEFIVYDVAQIKSKYLLRMKFDYKN